MKKYRAPVKLTSVINSRTNHNLHSETRRNYKKSLEETVSNSKVTLTIKDAAYILVILSLVSFLVNVKLHHTAHSNHDTQELQDLHQRKQHPFHRTTSHLSLDQNPTSRHNGIHKLNQNEEQRSAQQEDPEKVLEPRNAMHFLGGDIEQDPVEYRLQQKQKEEELLDDDLLINDDMKRLKKKKKKKKHLILAKKKKLLKEQQEKIKQDMQKQQQLQEEQELASQNLHTLAGLSCDSYGGPKDASEMVYWRDIPFDSHYISPFYNPHRKMYLTFEPDRGGWNNIRMSMENVFVLAHATGRTLVLPPEKDMYLLDRNVDFFDFFHIDSLKKEHVGMDIITMEEFLTNVAMKDLLLDTKSGRPKRPPREITNWDRKPLKELWDYLRQVTYVSDWSPRECIALIPNSPNPIDLLNLKATFSQVYAASPSPQNFIGKPVPVNASASLRMSEMIAERFDKVCLYNETIQRKPYWHLMASQEQTRLLAPFYSFLFFQDYHVDLYYKRFIRDHMRYQDKIMCAAARVIKKLRTIARSRSQNAIDADGLSATTTQFDALHVRRGDFQFKETRLDAPELLIKSKKQLRQGGVLYIATDERNLEFFAPFKKHYQVYFLTDFQAELGDLEKFYYGMIDQIITSRSRVFFGTWFSTFSSYANRMRGYYSSIEKPQGYQDGILNSWYFQPKDKDRENEMRVYWPIRSPYYMREFPVSWRDIDHGVPI